MQDIDINKNTKLKNIKEIAFELGIEKDIEYYGNYKAKINIKNTKKKKGKLILVTAISPTPLGEGKTTASIGIADALNKLGKKTVLTLREPSLGPVFGIKGGATGGGYSQVAPMEDINLHFTGDIHAITTANNLISAIIDNHIYFGNKLNFKKVTFKRCLDLNDRQLRCINTGLSKEKKIVPREDCFNISVASEIMATLCLSEDIFALKNNIAKIIVGFNDNNSPIYVKDLKIEGAITAILKDTIKPNLVQTLEGTPTIIHGGPFANIAHGCNSIIATNLALSLGEYTVTEAGFGSDLGAEKFLNIKCRRMNIKPDVVILVATLRAIKYHGGLALENITEDNKNAIDKGLENLYKHLENLQKFGLNTIVAINKFKADKQSELKYLQEKLTQKGITSSILENYEKGSNGALDIATKIINSKENTSNLKYTYNLEDDIKTKIKKVSQNIYGAQDVIYENNTLEKIEELENLGFINLPICIAKTQYSFSDNPKNLEESEKFNIHIKDIYVSNGSGFIVVIAGNIMTMPGLPKIPAAESIDIDKNGNIIGLF